MAAAERDGRAVARARPDALVGSERLYGREEPARAVPREREPLEELVGSSAAMRTVHALIERVARTDAPVFVTGETGTGKELVAQRIHRLSSRRAHAFVALNCGAVAPALIESELFGHEKGSFTGADRRHSGYFESANGGTLFLDEITEMPLELQVKLLRALESGVVTRVGSTEGTSVDVRIVAASNRDPLEAVAKGALRRDLFYRLHVFPIRMPALRDRGEDVTLLALHVLAQLNARHGTAKRFTADALASLRAAAWPGNVRELRNAVECAAILSDETIDADALPARNLREPVGDRDGRFLRVEVGTPLSMVERRLILATLAALGGNKAKTAETLGISLKTLYCRLSLYQLDEHDEQRPTSGA